MADLTVARRLSLDGTYNLRDVGGYATANGGRTRWGRLLRSDALHRLDHTGRDALRRLGVRTVIDLRDEQERAAFPSALGDLDARILQRPILDDTVAAAAARPGFTLVDLYAHILERLGDRLAAAVAELCRADALPALVHCTAGKDRTGLVAALALSAVGVDDADVCEDFALSARYLTGPYRDEARERMALLGQGDQDLIRQHAAEPAWMAQALRGIRLRHGGARGYLRRHGLTDEQLDDLRDALVDVPTHRRTS